MSEVKSKKVSRLTAIIISLVVTLIFSAVATIIAGLNIKHENSVIVALSTVFTGVATACMVMAIGSFITGAAFSSKFEQALAAFLLFFAFIFAMVIALMFSARWWIIVVLILCALPMPLLGITFIYRKNLVLVTDNQKPGYKDWKTREAEKKANPQEDEEELPEIKSFKN